MAKMREQWWGSFSLALNETAQWDIGPLRVAVKHLPGEWLVAQQYLPDRVEDPEWRWSKEGEAVATLENGSLSRFVFESEPSYLEAVPALADRPVVSRPFIPFTVPAGQKAVIYVSSPLWFTLAGGSPRQTLFETSIVRSSDTWFGPSTREGELCYASPTLGRLHLEDLTDFAYRAITQVHIYNDADAPLLVERLNLPVPYLSLFQMPDNAAYTESVTMRQIRGSSLTEFTINPLPDVIQGAAPKQIAAPRKSSQSNTLIRAFSSIKVPGFLE
ncbi:MAG: hypothetical protein ACK2UK_11840 [Candidatus Promineifilaceae bacterium]